MAKGFRKRLTKRFGLALDQPVYAGAAIVELAPRRVRYRRRCRMQLGRRARLGNAFQQAFAGTDEPLGDQQMRDVGYRVEIAFRRSVFIGVDLHVLVEVPEQTPRLLRAIGPLSALPTMR